MDGRAFDNLARRLGGLATRREALKAIIGGGVAVAVGTAVAVDDAAAVCGKAGVRCNRDAACCSGVCEWSTVTRGRRKVRVGACAAPACLADGATCADDASCCGGHCYGGTCHSVCADLSFSCDDVSDCCATRYCSSPSAGAPGICTGCVWNNSFGCTVNSDCCYNGTTYLCINGQCLPDAG